MRKKVSKRKKQGTELPLGNCFVCGHQHYRQDNTWVITASDKLLCEPMRTNCLDKLQTITENSTKEKRDFTMKTKYDTDGAIYSRTAVKPTKTNYRNKEHSNLNSSQAIHSRARADKIIKDVARELNPYYSAAKSNRQKIGTLDFRWKRVFKQLDKNLSRDKYATLLSQASKLTDEKKGIWLTRMEKHLGLKTVPRT
jgi:hypothetical protein